MKLLLDQNLSYKLVPALSPSFPGWKHLRDFGMTLEEDEAIWSFAAKNGFTIVSKDSDFSSRSRSIAGMWRCQVNPDSSEGAG